MKSHDDHWLYDTRSSLDDGFKLDKGILMRETTTPGLVVNPYDIIESARLVRASEVYHDWRMHFVETCEVSSDQ